MVAITFTLAVWFPLAVGAKVTLTVQVPSGARPAPPIGQSVATVYLVGWLSPRPLSVIVGFASSRFAVPVLDTVTGSTLVVLIATLPNGNGFGATVMQGACPTISTAPMSDLQPCGRTLPKKSWLEALPPAAFTATEVGVIEYAPLAAPLAADASIDWPAVENRVNGP